jgi:hypothetical protein
VGYDGSPPSEPALERAATLLALGRAVVVAASQSLGRRGVVSEEILDALPSDERRALFIAVDRQTVFDNTEAPMSASTIHVEPDRNGRWTVRHEGERESHSEHESATEAERVARALANIDGASLVLLHDRYARIHHLHTEGRSERS